MIFLSASDLCGRRDAANIGKPDAEGRAVIRGFMTVQSGNVAEFQKLPLPKASPAASGIGEGVHPMGKFCPRCEASVFTAPGASVPGQFEEVK